MAIYFTAWYQRQHLIERMLTEILSFQIVAKVRTLLVLVDDFEYFDLYFVL